MKKLLPLVLAVLFLASCEKETEVVTVSDNVAPPDSTIENITIDNYVQKLYISLLGRKATDDELSTGITNLTNADLSQESREDLFDEVIQSDEYYDNQFATMRSEYLSNADSSTFAEAIWVLEFSKTLTEEQVLIDFYDAALAKMQPLVTLEDDLRNGTKSVKEAHKIICDNYVYDQINMGSENYVVSLFQNWMLRYPTAAELDGGKSMYDGQSGVLFTETAVGRDGLVDLFFDHLEYYEGEVRTNFLKFLYREPTDDEIALLASEYQSTGVYLNIQKYILTSDEYIGIE